MSRNGVGLTSYGRTDCVTSCDVGSCCASGALRPTLRRPLPRRRLAILSPLAAPRFTESARNETGKTIVLERKCRFYPEIGSWLKV